MVTSPLHVSTASHVPPTQQYPCEGQYWPSTEQLFESHWPASHVPDTQHQSLSPAPGTPFGHSWPSTEQETSEHEVASGTFSEHEPASSMFTSAPFSTRDQT